MRKMADTAVAAPASYKQPSRKGKRAWRKNVDITEVQSGLENVRDEVIKGGIVSEKEADQLFATDIAGDAAIAKQQAAKKLLKADEILAQRSVVPGLDARKRKAEIVVPTSSKRYKDGRYVSHKELQRLKNVADNAAGGVAVEEHTVTHDPWAAPVPAKYAELDFLEPKRQAKAPKTLSHAPSSLTANGISVPHVRKPAGEKSYNPLVRDYAEHLDREGLAAVETEKARLEKERLDVETDARLAEEAAKVEAAERDEYGTDYESAWESEFEGFQTDGEQEEYRQKQRQRKTPAERNKVKARKEREAKEKHERKVREREVQEKRIADISREMSAKDRANRPQVVTKPETLTELKDRELPKGLTEPDGTVDVVSSDLSEDEPEVVLRKQRFGKRAVPDAPLEVVLPDELEDSLRRLKPEGNLLTDRYRNLIINGKIEPRKRLGQQKQKKVERLHKWSYKDWELK